MDSQSQTTSLQRLQNVEKVISIFNFSSYVYNSTYLALNLICLQRIVRVLELAGGVMDELANPTGPRKEFINNHCREFMQLIKVTFLSLSACLIIFRVAIT